MVFLSLIYGEENWGRDKTLCPKSHNLQMIKSVIKTNSVSKVNIFTHHASLLPISALLSGIQANRVWGNYYGRKKQLALLGSIVRLLNGIMFKK